MKDVLERESKWAVDRDFTLPRLDDLVANSRIEELPVELTSIYFDTAERDLLAHDLTLRRREGDDESGWQLKIPHSRGRVEVTATAVGTAGDENGFTYGLLYANETHATEGARQSVAAVAAGE